MALVHAQAHDVQVFPGMDGNLVHLSGGPVFTEWTDVQLALAQVYA